jgi:hypothetical protein
MGKFNHTKGTCDHDFYVPAIAGTLSFWQFAICAFMVPEAHIL